MAPRVSVVIATYNYSSVLPYSIGSALAQSQPPLEVLVVGDHCTDDTADVVAAIGDDRVRFVNLPARVGIQSGPNNEGIRLARGDVIAYLGHDDLWFPEHLAHVTAALDAGADVAYDLALDVRPDRPTQVVQPVRYRPGDWIPPTVVAHRRSATDRVGGWKVVDDLDRDPDRELWLRMHRAGLRIDCVERIGGVKLPASVRRDVYAERPSHEQATWAARIAAERDLEASEGIPALLRRRHPTLEDVIEHHAARRLVTSTATELARRLRRRMGRVHIDPATRYQRMFEERRAYKGADD